MYETIQHMSFLRSVPMRCQLPTAKLNEVTKCHNYLMVSSPVGLRWKKRVAEPAMTNENCLVHCTAQVDEQSDQKICTCPACITLTVKFQDTRLYLGHIASTVLFKGKDAASARALFERSQYSWT